MLKAIVVDDEAKARRILESFILEYCPQVTICALAEDVPQAVKAIKKYQPDVVFLDIEMPGYNGFQLLEFFDDINFEIVFITAYSQFALKAFEVSAIDYLLKPLQIDQLMNAVQKLEKIKGNSLIKERLETLKQNLHENKINKIVVPLSEGSLFIALNEITYLKAEGSYVHIFLNDGNKILVSKNIKDYQNVLTEAEGFFRTHRSYLINSKYLTAISADKTEATLKGNHLVQIARDKKADFLKYLQIV
jgi:two-component system LytT family response regulator